MKISTGQEQMFRKVKATVSRTVAFFHALGHYIISGKD